MDHQSSVPVVDNTSVQMPGSVRTTETENKETITLIWFDPNIGSCEDTERTQQRLRHINDYTIFYTDLQQCVTFIQSTSKEKILLITSGSKASALLPHITSVGQVVAIFIFCMKRDRYEHLLHEYSNIIGIYVTLNDLCQSIEQQVDLIDQQLQAFSFFDHHQKSTKDLSKQTAEFLWFQLFNYVINRLPKKQKAKEEMIQKCRVYYRGNAKEYRNIQDFEQHYRPEEAIRWYSKQSFVYQLVNKALRTEDIDQLYVFRFFICDLSKSLKEEHVNMLSSSEEMLTVYRGGKLEREEFDKLQQNQGKLISTNGYLSTSRDRAKALAFAPKTTKRTNAISVLFQIECDVKKIGNNATFANIDHLSEYPNEKEVLFDLNACFIIQSVEENGLFQLIKMNVSTEGSEIAQNFIDQHHIKEEKDAPLIFGTLLCELREYDKSQKYFEQLLNDPDDIDIGFIELNLGVVLECKDQWEEARKYYDHAYDRLMKNDPPRIKDTALVLNNIGNNFSHQGKYEEALDYYRRALEIREKYYPSGGVNIAKMLCNIGSILSEQEKYEEALDYHQRALKMLEKRYPLGHGDIVNCFDSIGAILYKEGKYVDALDHYDRALDMHEKYYPPDPKYAAQSLSITGNILYKQKKYEEALDHYGLALQLQEEYCPSAHDDITDSLNKIGHILYNLGNYDEALDFHKRAMKMQEKYYPSGHVDIINSLNNIGDILADQGKYHEALDHCQLALKMRKKLYSSDHTNIADGLHKIGSILHNQGKYDEALGYHQRALEIREKYDASDYAGIIHSLSVIGVTTITQGKYDETLKLYRRALEMGEKYYPSDPFVITGSLNLIGDILSEQGKYDEALDYYQRLVEIREKYCSSDPDHITQSLRKIGNTLYQLGKYDESMDYYQRALRMQEKCQPSDHLGIAASITCIGNILSEQGKYDEGLAYYKQALQMQTNDDEFDAVTTAINLHNIGIFYENQNKEKIALAYYRRALTIYERFLSLDHPTRKRTELNVCRLTTCK